MPDALRGPNHLAKMVEAGADPNADLDRPVEGTSHTRSEAAVAMAVAGASYSDIARMLGFSSAFNARATVERALAESADSPLERDRMRVLVARRLDRLLKSVMPKAVDPTHPDHLAYNARALALVDRQARLFGVDAPTQAVVYTPAAEKVERYVATVLALARAQGEQEEQDIVEAELED